MKRRWVVEYKIIGTAYAEVETEGLSEEDAIELAWSQYHSGAELDDLSWDVDDLNVELLPDEEE